MRLGTPSYVYFLNPDPLKFKVWYSRLWYFGVVHTEHFMS